jgi:hypothetical protein
MRGWWDARLGAGQSGGSERNRINGISRRADEGQANFAWQEVESVANTAAVLCPAALILKQGESRR